MKSIPNLTLFNKVVETGSFSSAARFFDLSPSAVSKQISQLESELDVRLFHRTTRKQSLTEAGTIYYQYTQRIQAESEAALVAVKQLSDEPSGILHVALEKDFAQTFIQPLLPAFFDLYPKIKLHLSMDSHNVDLIEHAIDIAIRVGNLTDSNMIARKLMSSPSVVCASPNYFAKHSKPTAPNQLSQLNCLSFRPHSHHLEWNLSLGDVETRVPVSGNLRANSLAFLKETALSGLGVIFVPKWFVQSELTSGALEALPFTSRETPVYALFTHKEHLAPKIRVFLDFLAEHLTSDS
jgi:DNA-binding transcriptional LysR family regulator